MNEQEPSGLLSSLGIRTVKFSKMPIVGLRLF